MTQAERMHSIRETHLADEVIEAPNQMTLALANKMGFDYVCHGDDVTVESFKVNWDKANQHQKDNMFYDWDLVGHGRYIAIPRSGAEFGISTSMLVERILERHQMKLT